MKIILYPNLLVSAGGPSTFQKNFINHLIKYGYDYSFNFYEVFRSKKEDIIIFSINTGLLFPVLWLLYLLGYKVVYRVGSYYPSNYFEDLTFRNRLYNLLVRKILTTSLKFFSSEVIFQSETVKREWSNSIKFDFSSSPVIYNPQSYFPDNEMPLSPSVQLIIDSIESLNNIAEKIIILVLETNHPKPAHHIGFKLAERLGDKCVLVIVGKFQWEWKEEGQSYNVLKCGFIEKHEIKALTQYCDLFLNVDVFPSGCPNSVIEALSLGLPVLCYKDTPAHELIDEYCGIAVKPNLELLMSTGLGGNYNDLINAVIDIKRNSLRMRAAAKTRSKKYNPEAIFSSYINLFKWS